MTVEQNKAIFLRFMDELRKGNFNIVEEVCSADLAFLCTHERWIGRDIFNALTV